MSIIGTHAAQSVAGLNQAERAQQREKDKGKETGEATRKALHDSVELVQAIDAVRNLKGNEQEEAHDDRREHNAYDPNAGEGEVRHIDIEG